MPISSSDDDVFVVPRPLLQPSRAKQIAQADLRGYVIRPICVDRQKAINMAILRMIVVDFQAFNVVQNNIVQAAKPESLF